MSHDNSSSQLILSISTIASAIADASISTDPSQLAAMIMELSKRGRKKNPPPQGGTESAGPAGSGVKITEEPLSHEQASTFTRSQRHLKVCASQHQYNLCFQFSVAE